MMVQVTRYDFLSLFRGQHDRHPSREEPQIVLHARVTNMYWVTIVGMVGFLVGLLHAIVATWHRSDRREMVMFGILATTIVSTAIAYMQRKARWVVAAPSGLTVTERTTVRKYPWTEVRAIESLGLMWAAPGARRYYIEFANGDSFTFFADPDEMKRLAELRPHWREQEEQKKRT